MMRAGGVGQDMYPAPEAGHHPMVSPSPDIIIHNQEELD